MNAKVTRSYHATVRQSDDLEVLITTIETSTHVFWSATLAKTIRVEGRHPEYEGLGMVSCANRYANHDDALESAISYFDGTVKDEPWSEDASAVRHMSGSCDDDCNWCISGVNPREVYS